MFAIGVLCSPIRGTKTRIEKREIIVSFDTVGGGGHGCTGEGKCRVTVSGISYYAILGAIPDRKDMMWPIIHGHFIFWHECRSFCPIQLCASECVYYWI